MKNKNKTKQKAQEDLDKWKKAIEKSEFDTLNKLTDVTNINTYSSLERCCDYLEAYNDYFEKGHKYLSQLMPVIQKYRSTIIKVIFFFQLIRWLVLQRIFFFFEDLQKKKNIKFYSNDFSDKEQRERDYYFGIIILVPL